ncbi:MAG TPA: hypothetical protein VIM88_09380 [Sulfurovum sp.]|uniref:hypothetical protein n=1 Tax=Sulfurovum sp. TaxID=1969726 RepID=UPI002F937B92
MTQTKLLLSVAAASVLALNGCGGGGDSTPPPTDDTVYEVRQVEDLKTAVDAIGSSTIGATTTGDLSYTGKTKEVLPANITSDLTLTTNKIWIIEGLVTVTNGATLTIPAGTLLAGRIGTGDNTSYLVIDKGAKIDAQGTATSPIIFTSEVAVDGNAPAPGQWGGVTLIGNAANDQVGAYEANTAFVPGYTNPADNSGTMTHVKVLNTGIAIRENEEVNGLSFVGVGSGTTISDITVENASDDGIELWGGTVNLSNLTIVNALDDSFDIDDGYSGTVTNLTINNIAGKAGVEMSGTTHATFNGFNIEIGSAQEGEGGIYFKKDGIGGFFSNGTITHNALNSDGALHSEGAADSDNISFDNVVLTGNSEYKITGDSAEILHTLFNGGN